MITEQVREFYVAHSPTSDPGAFSRVFDDLPVEIDELIDITGGLLMHIHTAHDLFGEPEPPDFGAGVLTITRMLQQLLALDPAPFTEARPPDTRLRVNCGRFAMFFLSILRHHGFAARKRAGFEWAGWIHEIVEYWDDRRNRWVLIDPDPTVREPIRNFVARTRQIEPADSDADLIRPGEAFTPGALAWRLCRAGQADPDRFHLSGHEGMSGIRVALLQDLDSLNKTELRTHDEWHRLITAPMDQFDEAALAWLDTAAALIEDSDTRFDELLAFYTESPYGSAVRTRLGRLVVGV